MEQPRCDGRRVHLQLRQHLRDFQRMPDVCLARSAALPLMLLDGERPRRADEIEIVGRAIGLDGVNKMLEASGEVGAVSGGTLRGRLSARRELRKPSNYAQTQPHHAERRGAQLRAPCRFRCFGSRQEERTREVLERWRQMSPAAQIPYSIIRAAYRAVVKAR